MPRCLQQQKGGESTLKINLGSGKATTKAKVYITLQPERLQKSFTKIRGGKLKENISLSLTPTNPTFCLLVHYHSSRTNVLIFSDSSPQLLSESLYLVRITYTVEIGLIKLLRSTCTASKPSGWRSPLKSEKKVTSS